MKKIIQILRNLFSLKNELDQLKRENNALKTRQNNLQVLIGNLFSTVNKQHYNQFISNIQQAEYKVFSQWGDDGIIQFLIDYIEIKEDTFIEFGVENYTEANTRFLLINNNWKGMIIDGSKENIDSVKQDKIYWRYDLTAIHAFVTEKNINQLLKENNFIGEIGILHIDIDGNDYWIWKTISVIDPIIVIMEYNSVFGDEKTWTIPYQDDFSRNKAHYSNLYYGSSLLALCDLATEKGYSFIGSNSNGNNAYFVRTDRMKKLKELNAKKGFVNSKIRESRNENGFLSFLSAHQRLAEIKGLPIYNTRSNQIETI